MNESVVERGNGVENPRQSLCGQTHEPSERQLPTHHDHEGGFGRSSDISVINRRLSHTSTTSSTQVCLPGRRRPGPDGGGGRIRLPKPRGNGRRAPRAVEELRHLSSV